LTVLPEIKRTESRKGRATIIGTDAIRSDFIQQLRAVGAL